MYHVSAQGVDKCTLLLLLEPCGQDEQHSPSHAELCSQVFEGYQLTGHCNNLNERKQET